MKSLGSKFKSSLVWKLIAAAVILLLPAILSGSNYLILVGCFIEVYIIAVSGLDINFGYCGQISMGHAAFYALGAYGSGMLHNFFGVPILLSMIIASIGAALIGALISYPASKLVFHFLSLSTIAFGEIIYIMISHSPNNITGNYKGLFSDYINVFGYEINTYSKFYYFGLVCVILFLLAKTFLVKSKIGRAFLAIRENTHAADGMGINVRKYKVISFTTSAFYTAFAGGMVMHLIKYVHPDTFTQKQSVLFLTMLLFGGTGSLLGPVVGVVTVLIITELLRPFQNYTMFIYGILLLIVIVLIPGGLYGMMKDFIKKIQGRFKHGKEVDTNVKG